MSEQTQQTPEQIAAAIDKQFGGELENVGMRTGGAQLPAGKYTFD